MSSSSAKKRRKQRRKQLLRQQEKREVEKGLELDASEEEQQQSIAIDGLAELLDHVRLDGEEEQAISVIGGLKLVGKMASTKREHLNRSRALVNAKLFHKEWNGVVMGDSAILLENGGKFKALVTLWPLESLKVDELQLSKYVDVDRTADCTYKLERCNIAEVEFCKAVGLAIDASDKWARATVRANLQKSFATTQVYVKGILEGELCAIGTVFGVLIGGYPCLLRASSLEGEAFVQKINSSTSVRLSLKWDDSFDVNERLESKSGSLSRMGGLDKQLNELLRMLEEGFQGETKPLGSAKGALLFGPPGTGKTLLARIIAHRLDAHFHVINGPEVISRYLGQAESRVSGTFDKAAKQEPSIVFIDEVDALCPVRSESSESGMHARIVGVLLQCMDLLHSNASKVFVIGATNRPNAINPALRRPGRFDREIEIGIPNKEERASILKVHLEGMPHNLLDTDMEDIASTLFGFVGADIMALCREASWNSLKRCIESGSNPKVERLDMTHAMAVIRPSALREFVVEIPQVSWSDIGGQQDVKQQLKEAVEWPLLHPDAFKRMGIRPPQGVLMYGPPGCSKTLLAKAVATEGKMNFIAIKGPELFNKYVGESEKAIHEVFRKARMAEPTVVFFDEIDALGGARGSSASESSGGVGDRVLSQLLTEMDGMEERKQVIVIAATNRPDVLDRALLRPGRLDRLVHVPPPDEAARLSVLKIHTRKMPLDDDVDLGEIADVMTNGFSGAELASLCREAAMNALVRDEEAQKVTMKDFRAARHAIEPQITEDMVKFYKDMERSFKMMT